MNPQRVHGLVARFNLLIVEHYKDERAPGREKVFEILNALANATALVLAGAGSHEAQEFFNDCLEQSIAGILADRERNGAGLN